MTEITRENIVEYLEYTYNKMLDNYNDTIINEIVIIIERLKRDSTVYTVKASVEDLQVICDVLKTKYHDDDAVVEFQLLINELANLFNITPSIVDEGNIEL